MCVPCSANKCRIRESDLQATCLYIIFLNGYYSVSGNSAEPMRRKIMLVLLRNALSRGFAA